MELEERSEIVHVILQSIADTDPIPEIQIYILDQGAWRLGGTDVNVRSHVEHKIKVQGIGTHLKLHFPKATPNISG